MVLPILMFAVSWIFQRQNQQNEITLLNENRKYI